mmetsp:Transcript_20846/g.29424  ORF Transcript_20846/g.29424 Transcript_20846/m.29424 type:complete len:497 (+) Transcript_20846:100-1590(+)
MASPSPNEKTESTSEPKERKVVFVHLDLGIGGAEQLVLSLATASQDLGHNVEIVTSHCSQDHCFSHVKKPDGRLCNAVHVWGEWIPPNVLGKATALCSTLRMIFLAYKAAHTFADADVFVLDVLPTPIPFLIHWWNAAGVLFYCHFPDKLLTRDTVNGEPTDATHQRFFLFTWYRQVLDYLEESTMGFSDVLVVNSKFTQSNVIKAFESLAAKPMRVLYPALDTSKFDENHNPSSSSETPIVSLNRFERKKNIELLLQAYAELRDKLSSSSSTKQPPPPLVIAGGYDPKNVENVEYMGELRQLAKELDLKDSIRFRLSISDEERSTLFETALCIVYTPHLEHFGIVPLEAMYAGRPVVAVKSGGPMETVVNGKTGYLCEPAPGAFGQALYELTTNPQRAQEMGRTGHNHVKEKFGVPAFQKQWGILVEDTVQEGKKRLEREPPYLLSDGFYYLFEAMLVLLATILLTWFLQGVGILEPNATIWGTVKRTLMPKDEL